jgi:integrase/recombinase XerD
MSESKSTLRIRQIANLDREIDAFLVDRRARGLSPGTILFYEQKLAHFEAFLNDRGISTIEAINAPLVRRFLLSFSEEHNAGGVHAVYRAVKAFLRWYELEVEPAGWRNPMPKVQPPKVPQEPLEPVEIAQVKKMLATCTSRSPLDLRDRAVMLALLDTGCRASELIALNVGDVQMRTGSVLVRHGKGGKFRTVFLGAKARRALAAYLRSRENTEAQDPLFATAERERLKYEGLRDIVRRRAEKAGIQPAPTLHSFRRAFALLSLRNGVDIYSLQRLMGHADLSVLRRYLAQTEDDLRQAHERTGPADNML